MIRFIPNFKFEEKKEGEAPNAAPPKSEGESNPPAGDPPAKEEGNTHDEFGYEKVSEGDPKEKRPEKKEEPAEESEKVEDPATGYGDEPKVDEEEPPKPDEKKADDKPPEPDEIDKAIGDGLAKEESAAIKEFATKHKMTPDQVKAYADLRREEYKAAEEHAKNQEKEAKLASQRVRASWHKELKEDKDFGGANFNRSISKAEKVLAEFMPSTKKILTESKGMLPPYVMRDLAKLAEHLYKTEKLVTGDPKVEEKAESKDSNSHLGFYN
jgi:hypothetical protein